MINDVFWQEWVLAPSRRGRYWKIHPRRPKISRDPRDFPRAKPEGNLEGRGKSWEISRDLGFCTPRQRQRQRQSTEKTQHVLHFWKAEGSRISNMTVINRIQTASSAYHQRIISASLVHHHCIISTPKKCSKKGFCWCADSADVLILLMRWFCWCAVALMRWFCWSADAADAVM